MHLPKEVRLPRGQVPVFPERCAVCGVPRPNDAVLLRTRGLWQSGGNPLTFLPRLFRAPVEVAVPACSDCARGYHSHRAVKRALVWLAAAAGGVGIAALGRKLGLDPTEGWFGVDLTTVLAIGVALAIVLPLEYFLMLPIDITVDGNALEYEFRDHELAEEFARLNGAKVED